MPVLTKINTNVIADDAVTSAKIPAGAVIASDIADDGVTSAKIAPNITLTGDYVGIPPATTTERDALTAVVGMLIYNSTIGIMQQYNAEGWTSIATAPTITTVTDNVTDGNYSTIGGTIKLVGQNFGISGATVTIGGVAATSVSHTVGSTQLTAVVPTVSLATHDVVVTSASSGLTATSINALTVSANPSWASNVGDVTMEYTQGRRVTNGAGTEGTSTYQSELFLATSATTTVTQAISGLPAALTGKVELVQHGTPANGYYLSSVSGQSFPAVATDTTYSFNIVATEATEIQIASLAVSIKVLVNFFGFGGTP